GSRNSSKTLGVIIAIISTSTPESPTNLAEYFQSKHMAPALLSLLLAISTAWLVSLSHTSANYWLGQSSLMIATPTSHLLEDSSMTASYCAPQNASANMQDRSTSSTASRSPSFVGSPSFNHHSIFAISIVALIDGFFPVLIA
ncbi:MAG: hypothetical protein SGPRY_009755, partial [Prymnesium sp.]